MHELRFRAWFDGPQLMGNVITLKGSNRNNYEGNMWDEVTAECFIDGKQQFYSSYNFILLQYTGLKDKNGVDIFESDICLKYWQQDLYADREPMIGVIKWVDFGGRFTHECNGLYGHKYYHELHENFTHEDYPRSMFEVVGNIYQHKHLLK